MLGNGIMGAGIVTEPVVTFALVVWAGFVFLLIMSAVWTFRFVRAHVENLAFFRESFYSSRPASLNIGISERRKEMRSKGKIAA